MTTLNDIDQLEDLYLRMLRIRAFETRITELFEQKAFRGPAHLYVGMEAIAVGVCASLRDDDYITSTHRGHGH
jgi:TPP-dependent pyruvate/acetoin dehydrogenase alpha subunit